MKLIDKAAVVAEIEDKIKKYTLRGEESDFLQDGSAKYWGGVLSCLNEIHSYLNTLEVKEENFIWNNARTTVPEDSTNQIICIKEDGLAVSTVGKIVNGTIKWAYLDDLLNINSFNVEVKEVDLEKIIKEEYLKRRCYGGKDNMLVILNEPQFNDVTKHFFELGLKAQKGE